MKKLLGAFLASLFVDLFSSKPTLDDLNGAIFNNDIAKVKKILKDGINVNQSCGEKEPPLNYAASRGYNNIIKLLIENGANVNFVGENNITPLSRAIRYGQLETVKLLISNGARIIEDYEDLSLAVQFDQKKIIEFLIQSGANVNAFEPTCRTTALTDAIYEDNYDIVKLLIKYGADVNHKVYDRYIEQEIDAKTPLTYAANNDNLEIAMLLIKNGAKDDVNHTALNWAQDNDYIEIIDSLEPNCRPKKSSYNDGNDYDDNDYDNNQIFEEALKYYYGFDDCAQDYETAYSLFLKAIEFNNTKAYYYLGKMNEDGEIGNENLNQALYFYKEGNKVGEHLCTGEIASIYSTPFAGNYFNISQSNKYWKMFFDNLTTIDNTDESTMLLIIIKYLSNSYRNSTAIQFIDELIKYKKKINFEIDKLIKYISKSDLNKNKKKELISEHITLKKMLNELN